MVRSNLYNEKSISQKPAIEVLKKLGYTYIPSKKAEEMRGNLYNVLLTDILKKKLMELNKYQYKGESYKFSEKILSKL